MSTEPEVTGEIIPATVTPPAEGGLSPLARAAVAAGISDETRRAYARDWREFTGWCAQEGRTALPCSAVTLAEYTAYICYQRPVTDRGGIPVAGKTGVSPSSAKRMLGSILAAHKHADLPAPRTTQARSVIKGYEARLADDHDPRAVPAKASPFSPQILTELTGRGLQGTQELIRLRDMAMMYLTYVAATRVSELVRINIEDVTEEERGLVVSVYRVKTRQHGKARIPSADCPAATAALKAWIAALAEHGRTSGPLFPGICKHGKIGGGHCGGPGGERIAERRAEIRVRAAQQEAGLEGRFTVHSGRHGFAGEATIAGHSQLAIARHGRAWADHSTSLAGYIAEAEEWTMNPLKGAGA